MADTVCIINPNAAGGRTARAWPKLAEQLAQAGLVVEARFTERAKDATELTRRALADGAKTVVAVGGDGTIHEVANGFFAGDMPMNPAARLGILPAGTGSDLIRTLGIPKDAAGAIAVLQADHERVIDLGRATYTNHAGERETCRFINVASLGLSGAVIDRVETLPAFLKGGLRYNIATLLAFLSYDAPSLQIAYDDEPAAALDALILFVGNGRYLGGGMHAAPSASITDGELDFVALRRGPLPQLIGAFAKIYAGTHLDLPLVEHGRGKRISVDCSVPLKLEIDGEVPGFTPVTYEVVPAVLKVLAPEGS